MKCPNCGGESTGAFCSYCGSEMPKQPINIINNYYSNNNPQDSGNNVVGASCPNCGGTKISFNRESTGTMGYHKTVAVCKSCGNTWITAQDVKKSSKNKVTALILCIFLGYFGAHQFYVGKSGMGFLYIITVGLFGIGWIVDIIRIACGSFTDAKGFPLR